MVKKNSIQETCDCFYKLIIMDCNMPIMDGFESCTQLKTLMKEGQLKKAYIIAYTANIAEDNIKKCLKFQFDQVYNKPFKKGALVNLLKKVFTVSSKK